MSEQVRKLFKNLQKIAQDDEAVENQIDNYVEKVYRNQNLGPTRKAVVTDNLMHKLLGEAALDEIEGLADKPIVEAIQTAKEYSNKGLTDLEKSLDINPKIVLRNLQKETEEEKAYGTYHPTEVEIDKSFNTPTSKDLTTRQMGQGVGFHETVGHSLDEAARRLALVQDEVEKRAAPDYKLKKFRKNVADKNYKPTVLEMMSDEELARYYANIKQKMDFYIKNNPGKLEDFLSTQSIRKFESQKVPDLLPSEFWKMSPTKLQNLYSGTGHWFQRNFPFSNLKNAIKGGIKGIKGVGIGMIPAAAATLVAAYSPNSKAATATKTLARATDEGDPLSILFPPEAGEGEDAEVKKMYEEEEQKRMRKKNAK